MRHSPLLNRNESTYSSIPLRYISLMWHSPLLNRNESTYSSIPLRYLSLMRHSSLLNRNESTYSSIPLRYISLMRHSPHHQKRNRFFLKASFLQNLFLFWCMWTHCLRTKKAPSPQLHYRNGTRKCAIRGSNPGHPD